MAASQKKGLAEGLPESPLSLAALEQAGVPKGKGMSRVTTHVSMAVAKRRALAFLKKEGERNDFIKASQVGLAVWPDSSLRAQGFGGAGSRILKLLEKEGLVRWHCRDDNWGWQVK